jgi:hypothetical protein
MLLTYACCCARLSHHDFTNNTTSCGLPLQTLQTSDLNSADLVIIACWCRCCCCCCCCRSSSCDFSDDSDDARLLSRARQMIELPSTIEEAAVEDWKQQLVRAGERGMNCQHVHAIWAYLLHRRSFKP